MSDVFRGGCSCGEIRYKIADEPIVENHCHCSDCRRRSGTGHGSYLTFADRTKIEITGKPATWETSGNSGNEKSHAFCPACGAPLYVSFMAMPNLLAIHAGSLDDPARFQPSLVTYADSRLSWDTMDMSLTIFPKMPPG